MNGSAIPALLREALSEFDPGTIDFAAIKDNIRWYSAINLTHGALHVPLELPAGPSSVDPMSAESDDRRRQAEAAAAVAQKTPETSDPELPAQLLDRYERGIFPPFDFKQNIVHALQAIAAITGYLPREEEFKSRFVGALNLLQRTSLPCRDSVVISFDNPALLDELCREGVITPNNAHLFSPPEQERIVHAITDAFSYIRAVDADLHDAIRLQIATITPVRREGSSGTVSSMVGLIWLNPTPAWTVVDFAENLVHEFIHNTIFLADMVNKIFTTPHWYAPDDGLVVSAIKQYPRAVNIAYHSAFVAIGLALFLARANQYARAAELTTGIATTLAGLKEKGDRFLSPYAASAVARLEALAVAHASHESS